MSVKESPPPGPVQQRKADDPPTKKRERRDDTDGGKPKDAPAKPDAENKGGEQKTGEPKKDDPGARKRFLLSLGIGAAVLAVLLLIGLVPRLRARPALDKRAKENAQTTPEVDVVHPERAPRMTTLQLPGNIEALQDTDITARATGYVSQWLVDIGDPVKAGQTLAVISTPEVDQQVRAAEAALAQSQAALVQQRSEEARAVANLAQSRQNAERQKLQLVQAQADLNLAKVTADRWTALVREGAVSQQSADEKVAALRNNQANVAALRAATEASRSDIAAYEAALRSAQANVGAAQAGVRASQADLKRIQDLRAFRYVRAPFSGVVTARSVDAGSLIGGGGSADAGSGASSGGGSRPPAGSGATAPSATTTASQGTGSARRAMYGSTPDAGRAVADSSAAGGGGAATAGGGSTIGNYGDSQAAAGGAAGSAAAGGATGATASSGNAGGGGSAAAGDTSSGAARSTAGSASTAQSGGVGGAAISPGVSLYHIARIDVLRIAVNVPQSFAPTVQVGSVAKISVREYPGREFVGKVTRTARSLDLQTRTMLTEVQIANRDKRLLPGMYAQVQFSVSRATPPLIIPAGALIDNGRGTQVATVDSDNKVRRVPVTVGRDYGQQIEISEGLKETDWLVTDPSDATNEGATVQPITPDEKKRRQDEQQREQQQKAQGKPGRGAGGESGSGDRSGQGQPSGQGRPAQGGGGSSGQNTGQNESGGRQGNSGAAPGGGSSRGGPPPNLGQSYGGGLSETGESNAGASGRGAGQ